MPSPMTASCSCLGAGMNDHIAKPFDARTVFYRCLLSWLRQTTTADAGTA
jgi:CheY-like chemotaxis protein